MSVRILIADDHAAVRSSLRNIFGARPDWEICGEAQNGREALAAAKQLHPDVMILDITMPKMNGLEVAREIARLNLNTRVLICSTHASRTLDEVVRDVGAQGYALKSAAGRDLVQAVETLLDGGTFFTSEVPRSCAQHTSEFAAAAEPA
jgi:two-component system, NarL family, response regulator NreC